MSKPDRVQCNLVDLSFLASFLRQGQNVQESDNNFEDILRSDDEGPLFITEYGTTCAPEFFSQFLTNL